MKKHKLGLIYLAVVAVPAIGIWPSGARAAPLVPEQFSVLFKINDDNPEASVPTAKDRIGNPLEFGYYVQDLLTRAEVEGKRNNQAGVIKYLRALAAALPEEARSWALLCEAYQTARDRDRAVRACKYAIERQGVQLKDYQHYVDLMVAKPTELLPEERRDLNEALEHLDEQPDLAVPTAHLRCQAGVKMNDEAALEACTAVLAKVAPNDPKTVVFQWSLAVMRGDRKQAASLLARGKQMGLAAASIDRMNEVVMGGRGWWRIRSVPGALIVAGGAVLLGLSLFLGYRRRFVTGARRAAR